MTECLKVAIIGTGYVGLVSGSCFSSWGHKTVCVDKDADKIASLRQGVLPIHEPGLKELVDSGLRKGTLAFTTDLAEAVADADAVFLAVGTPSLGESGQANLTFAYAAAREMAAVLCEDAVVVTKSTVSVGTGDELEQIIAHHRGTNDFSVVSNPEFLREGSAISDFMNPERVVVGTEVASACQLLLRLYKPLADAGVPIFVTQRRTAELIKYASNSFLAAKIAFINEIADLCEAVGADVRDLAAGIGLDSRIGAKFLNAGPGYGGSCFPKDTRALLKTAKDYGVPLRIVEQAVAANTARGDTMVGKIRDALGGDVKGASVSVLGLSFKAGTDDVRESPALSLIEKLQKLGASVKAFDPVAMENAAKILRNVGFAPDAMNCVAGADVLVIATEWNDFKSLDWPEVRRLMVGKIIVDLRNVLNTVVLEALGFAVSSIGYGKGNQHATIVDYSGPEGETAVGIEIKSLE